MKRNIVKLLLVSLFLVLGLSLFATSAAADTSAEYLVVMNRSRIPRGMEAKIEAAGGEVVNTMPEIGIVVARSADVNFQSNVAAIKGVRSAPQNLVTQWVDPTANVFEMEGNPPNSGDDDFYFDLQWGHDAVDAPEAWDDGYRGAGARVAVLDTGFDTDHVDLAPNINYALSYDFTGEGLEYAIDDPFSHGTHTAGTVAAADNGFGTIGVAPDAELVLLKVLSDAGSGTFEDIIDAVVYAASPYVNADVISMSLGATLDRADGLPDDVELWFALGRALAYAHRQGTTIITSAGNDGIDYDANPTLIHLPSDGPFALSISATAPIGWATDPANTNLDNLASYSNYGARVLAFGAPGGDFIYPGNENCLVGGLVRPCWVFDFVFSTGSNLDPNVASYYWSVGTSMAAPHAAGVAAIIIGANGGSMHPNAVEAALTASADHVGPAAFFGDGRVNACNAVCD